MNTPDPGDRAGVFCFWQRGNPLAIAYPFLRGTGYRPSRAVCKTYSVKPYSGWMLAALMMRPHLSDSWVWNLASSAGVLVNTSVPVDL